MAQIQISSLSHIDFGQNGSEYKYKDGGMPIVPINGYLTIKEVKGVTRINTIHVINEKTKVVTQIIGVGNFRVISPCCVRIRILSTLPCGVYRMYVNMNDANPLNKILSLPFQITCHAKGLVTIRTTNHNDIRYRTRSTQEYFYYYAYLANWREQMNEKVTKYDNGQGEVVPLVNHHFKTYQFSTYATDQHTLMMLGKICNNDFINISFDNTEGVRTYYEVVRTPDAPTYGTYDRTNAGTFACSFVGENVSSNVRYGIFTPLLQQVYIVNTKTYIPISQMCQKVKAIEYGGTTYNFETTTTYKFDKVTEIPDNFMNFRRVSQSYELFDSNKVKKIGKNFGNMTSSFEVYFENVQEIGRGFKCATLKGLIKIPQTLDTFYLATNSAKSFGSNIVVKNSNIDTIANLNVTFAKFENCYNRNTHDISGLSAKLIQGAEFDGCRFVDQTKLPSGQLTVKNCGFIPKDNNTVTIPYELDLSVFAGAIENSFNMAGKELTITEAVSPTYAVDNASFVGTRINSNYLKTKIDSIRRYNQGTGTYEQAITIDGNEVSDLNTLTVQANDRSVNGSLSVGVMSLTFNANGTYQHAPHFLEGYINTGGATLDLRDGTHTFSDYFLNNAEFTSVSMYLSQFMDLLQFQGFNPTKDTNIYIYDDGATFDYYYLTLGDNLTRTPTPSALYIQSTLTALYAKLTALSYSNLYTF